MTTKTKRILTISLTALAITAFVITPLAWFAGFKLIGNIGFKPSYNANLPDLQMWMYNSENDIQAGSEVTTEGWVSKDVTPDTENNSYLMIPGVKKEKDGNGNYTISISQLHFGKVDNLVSLSRDNKVMLCFGFDKNTINNTTGTVHDITFTLAYNTNGYTYDMNSESVLDSIHLYQDTGTIKEKNLKDLENGVHIIEYREEKPAAMQFLQIRYAISSQKYVPYEDGFVPATENADGEWVPVLTGGKPGETLTLSDVVPINCGRTNGTCVCTCGLKCEACDKGNHTQCEGAAATESTNAIPACSACDKGRCGKAELTKTMLTSALGGEGDVLEDGAITGDEKFYVYIELAPLLDAFGMQENILDYFVPAYMFFDVKLDVEIG